MTLPGVGAFTAGSLSTHDGSDYFTLSLTFGRQTISFGQPDLHASDWQEAVWARFAEADDAP